MTSRAITFSGFSPTDDEPPSLEGRFHVPQDGALHPGVVLCHANPAAGGNMDMQVMLALEEALSDAGFATLRYNSRGIGGSTGAVSQARDGYLIAPEGTPETHDIGMVLRFLGAQSGVDEQKLALVGHSFGARIILAYLAAHPEETGVVAVTCIGLPVAWRDLTHLGQWPHPKLFVTGERDDFCPPDALKEFVDGLPEPSNIVTLRDTGHFFEGREEDLADVVTTFLRRVTSR